MTLYITPFHRMTRMQRAMNRMLAGELAEAAAVEPEIPLAVDVLAEDDAYEITAMVPGLDAEDIEIEILNKSITLRGEFKSNQTEEGTYLMRQLPAGRFSRVITLPSVLDHTKAEASINHGILKLRIPKAESHQPKKINITVA